MDTQTIIKTLLGEHGMSQHELARLTGIPQPRLSKWASSHVPASVDDGLKLLKVLNDKQKKGRKK